MWDLSFSALNEDSGFWPRLQRRCYGGFRRLSGLSQRFWLSRAYFPFLLWVALGFAALRQPVYGAMALLGICIWLLVFCRDLLASVTPFLLVFLQKGAIEIATQFNLNSYAANVITGIILFCIIGSEFFINYKLIFRKKKGGAQR